MRLLKGSVGISKNCEFLKHTPTPLDRGEYEEQFLDMPLFSRKGAKTLRCFVCHGQINLIVFVLVRGILPTASSVKKYGCFVVSLGFVFPLGWFFHALGFYVLHCRWIKTALTSNPAISAGHLSAVVS